MDAILRFVQQTGFYMLFAEIGENWVNIVMILVSLLLLWLAIKKKFEPLLLIGIAFGMLLTNLPGAEMYHDIFFAGGHVNWEIFNIKYLVLMFV